MSKRRVIPPITYVYFILDASGSMGYIKQEAMNDFNEKIQELQSSGQDVRVTLTTFCNPDSENVVYKREKVSNVSELTEAVYSPNGSTAMLDAFGNGIRDSEKIKLRKKDAVLFIVISDGQENSSKYFNYKSIKDLVEEKQLTGQYTFSYLGANQDILEVAKNTGIPVANTMNFTSTSSGTTEATAYTNTSLSNYMTSRSCGQTMSSEYFNNNTTDIENEQPT